VQRVVGGVSALLGEYMAKWLVLGSVMQLPPQVTGYGGWWGRDGLIIRRSWVRAPPAPLQGMTPPRETVGP
jgi:hypothetical protein